MGTLTERHIDHRYTGIRRLAVQTGGTLFIIGMAIGSLAFCLFALVSCTLPIVCLVVHLTMDVELRPLEVALSGLYCSFVVFLLWLSPAVNRHQYVSIVLHSMLKRIASHNAGNRTAMLELSLADGAGESIMRSIEVGYQGWLVGCQVQRGLVERFGTGIPEVIHTLYRNGHLQSTKLELRQ